MGPARSPYQFNPRMAKVAPIMSAKGTPRKAQSIDGRINSSTMTPNFDARKLSGGNLALPSMAGPLRRDENMRFETTGGGGLARYGRTVNQSNIQIKGIPSPVMNKPITVD